MVVHAIARMVSVALIAQHRQPAKSSNIVLRTGQQLTLMQPMDAHAPVWTVFMGLTVPFHQLAAALHTAMDTPLWTKIVQMDACAIVRMDSLAKAAKSHQRATLTLIAAVMGTLLTRTRLTVALAIAQMILVVMIALLHQHVKGGGIVLVTEKPAT